MLTVIGDVHGKIGDYTNLLSEESIEYSVQLGDMGFKSSYEELDDSFSLESLDLNTLSHRFIPGNHDDYDNLPSYAYREPFGEESLGGVDFFYIRGAYSLDKVHRTPRVSWWEREELSIVESFEAADYYVKSKPSIILTHDCPLQITALMGYSPIKTRTGQLLQELFNFHKPDLWIFGHYHRSFRGTIDGTEFICLDELETLNLTSSGILEGT